ncbi:hypothetical protein I4F81_006345 [Pyropia yezoensis]|uniref:Uncharacterized protein n=1 Tax=Pyropia yezoensis TaxID=2788 RepID=A0ACC3C0I1_PYRYE|nr:hypothetical protein I4F81_006345 [Neopyropia yezoensis]
MAAVLAGLVARSTADAEEALRGVADAAAGVAALCLPAAFPDGAGAIVALRQSVGAVVLRSASLGLLGAFRSGRRFP